jgi:hypothetical protein
MADRKSLEQAIAREEALLSKLDKAVEQVLSRIQEFKHESDNVKTQDLTVRSNN